MKGKRRIVLFGVAVYTGVDSTVIIHGCSWTSEFVNKTKGFVCVCVFFFFALVFKK